MEGRSFAQGTTSAEAYARGAQDSAHPAWGLRGGCLVAHESTGNFKDAIAIPDYGCRLRLHSGPAAMLAQRLFDLRLHGR